MRSGSAVVSRGRTARPAPALPAFVRERPGLVAVPALALVLWLVYGSGYVDYDALYALVWGQVFAGLGWAAYRLGERLFAPATGAVLALILLTRPVLVHQALTANVDVPFLALVLAAAAMEAARPRRGWPGLATLGVGRL